MLKTNNLLLVCFVCSFLTLLQGNFRNWWGLNQQNQLSIASLLHVIYIKFQFLELHLYLSKVMGWESQIQGINITDMLTKEKGEAYKRYSSLLWKYWIQQLIELSALKETITDRVNNTCIMIQVPLSCTAGTLMLDIMSKLFTHFYAILS